MADDRRRAPRVRAYYPVRLHRTGDTKIIETLTKDVAVGGFRCLSPVPVPVSAELSVELVVSRGSAPLVLRGRAVWFSDIPQSDQFEIGIAFSDILHQNKRLLSTYIDHISSNCKTQSNS